MKCIIRNATRLLSIIVMAICFLASPLTAEADDPVKLYYEDNAQIELISPKGSRVLIDVYDPNALSSPPGPKDVLLTTHNHGDHYRLDFVKTFPGKQLKVMEGEIKLEDVAIRGIASAHNEGDELKPENGSNYIYVVDMGGIRIAHFGDIGQDALTDEQLTALGKVDIAVTQLSNSYSNMNTANKKGFKLMERIKPRLIIPTHIFEPSAGKLAAEKWAGTNSYKKSISINREDLTDETRIVFMGRNAYEMKLPNSDL